MERPDPNTVKIIGTAFANYLKERGMTQKKAAELSGVDAQTVCDIARGVYRVGKLNAQRLHDTFGFSIDFLRNGIGTLLPQSTDGTLNASPQNIHAIMLENEKLRAEVEQLKRIIEKQKIAISALNELS